MSIKVNSVIFQTATVHVRRVGNLRAHQVLHCRGILSQKEHTELCRIIFKFARFYFLVAVSPTILLLLFMRSTVYCHCMGGYSYLELVYQHTTFTTEQS